MGCGDDYKDGYVGCDVRKTKTAKIICKAWELSKYCKNVNEIYSRHMVEHLDLYRIYCATLIKIKVITMEYLHSNKFNYFKYTPQKYSGNIIKDIYNSKIYKFALDEVYI